MGRLREHCGRLLLQAVASYVAVLCSDCDQHAEAVPRLCGLWFSNADVQAITGCIARSMDAIPPRVWLPLAYQLSARYRRALLGRACARLDAGGHGRLGVSPLHEGHSSVGAEGKAAALKVFQEVLTNILLGLARRHPHETVWKLLLLAKEGEVSCPLFSFQGCRVLIQRG
jgi:hypothetical protein